MTNEITKMNSNHISILANNHNLKDIDYEDAISEYLNSLAQFSEAEQEAILENVSFKVFKKGDFILQEGDLMQMSYFLLKGCVREYFLKDGEEKTTNFFIEQDSITTMNGNNHKTPSKCFLECLEDTVVTTSTLEQDEKMLKKFPQFQNLCRQRVEEKLTEEQQRFAVYMTSTPTERYLHLLETRPDLLDRVPQYQLASFIGIKPETLSRIRRKISKNGK